MGDECEENARNGRMAKASIESPTRAAHDYSPTLQVAALMRDRYFLWWRLAVRVVEATSLVALGRDGHASASR